MIFFSFICNGYYVGPVFKPEDLDTMLMNLEPGVDLALKRAKAWSKYAKDIITYVDKRAHFPTEDL